LQVRLVTEKDTSKPRGYAFIEYVHTRDMKSKVLFFFVANFPFGLFLTLLITYILSANLGSHQMLTSKQMGEKWTTGGY
jgi:RNA recognition motif-containing protein